MEKQDAINCLNTTLGSDLCDLGDVVILRGKYVAVTGQCPERVGQRYCGVRYDGRYYKVFADGRILVRDLPDGRDRWLDSVPKPLIRGGRNV